MSIILTLIRGDNMNKTTFIRTIGLQVNDPLYKRVFKSKVDYIKEGYVIASDVYSNVIEELEKEFQRIANEFEITGNEKKIIIDELIWLIRELKKEQPDDKKNELLILLENCIELFKFEIQTFSSEHMKNISLDKKYSDWRYVYGITEKN